MLMVLKSGSLNLLEPSGPVLELRTFISLHYLRLRDMHKMAVIALSVLNPSMYKVATSAHSDESQYVFGKVSLKYEERAHE